MPNDAVLSTFTRAKPEVVQGMHCSINVGDCRSPILSDIFKALLKTAPLIPRFSCIHNNEATELHLTLKIHEKADSKSSCLRSLLVKSEAWRNRNIETHPQKSDLLSRMRHGSLAWWNLSILAKAVPVLRTDEFSFLLHQTVTFISPTCAQKKARKNFYWHHT